MRGTPQERFEAKVEIDESGCWLWNGGKQAHNGYGQFWDGDRMVMAHRWSFEAAGRYIPSGMELDHLCRVRSCVNPGHLDPVPGLVNTRRATGGVQDLAYCSRGHLKTPETIGYVTYRRGARVVTQRRCKRCHSESSLRSQRRSIAAHETGSPVTRVGENTHG